jgi:hypothetical protein
LGHQSGDGCQGAVGASGSLAKKDQLRHHPAEINSWRQIGIQRSFVHGRTHLKSFGLKAQTATKNHLIYGSFFAEFAYCTVQAGFLKAADEDFFLLECIGECNGCVNVFV